MRGLALRSVFASCTSPYRYEAAASSRLVSREAESCVLCGTIQLTGAAASLTLGPQQLASIPAGRYEVKVAAEEQAEAVLVWDLSVLA